MIYKKHTHTGNRAFRPILISISFLLLSMFSSNSLFAQTEFSVTNNSSCNYWVRYGWDDNCTPPYTFTSGYVLVANGTSYTDAVPNGEEMYRTAVANLVNGFITIFQVWNCSGVEFDRENCGGGTDQIENTGWSVKIEPQ